MKWQPQRVKKILKEQKKTQDWLAVQMAMSRMSVTCFLNGLREPNNRTVRLMAIILDCREEYLWGQSQHRGEHPLRNHSGDVAFLA